jgi:hypothetical protein
MGSIDLTRGTIDRAYDAFDGPHWRSAIIVLLLGFKASAGDPPVRPAKSRSQAGVD